MTEINVEIMVKVITVLGIATKEIRRGWSSALISRRFYDSVAMGLRLATAAEVHLRVAGSIGATEASPSRCQGPGLTSDSTILRSSKAANGNWAASTHSRCRCQFSDKGWQHSVWRHCLDISNSCDCYRTTARIHMRATTGTKRR